MKKSYLLRIISMILVLCMLFTSCKKNKDKHEDEEILEEVCQHTEVQLVNANEATCITEGYTGDKVCTLCNTVLENGQVIPLLAHTPTLRKAKPATCVTQGYTGDQVCTACGTIVEKGEAISKVAHTYDAGMTTKLPTCINTGTTTFTCTQCGATHLEEIPTVAHDDVYHDRLDGTHSHTCSYCARSSNEEHTPVEGSGRYVPATCLEKGYMEYTCSVCNCTYREETDQLATGHSWGAWSGQDATCLADGYKKHTCTVCGTEEELTIQKTPDVHNYAFSGYQGGVAPTCTSGAVAIYTCVDCRNANYTQSVPASAHLYVINPTPVNGYTYKSCTACGHTISSVSTSGATTSVTASNIPTDVPFQVNTQNASIEFPTSVISQLKGGATVSIDASVLSGTEKENAIANAISKNANSLTEAQLESLSNVDLYDFTVSLDSDVFSDNFAAPVRVTVPYTLKTIVDDDGNETTEDPYGIIVWYVANDGSLYLVGEVQYDEDSKTVSFLAPHFSMYAVAYEETQQMKCRRGYHDFEVIETVDPTCASYGYTLYRCSGCKRISMDAIQDRLQHTYGSLIEANPTCTSGDYDHKVCAGCGNVLNIKYHGALSHTLDAAPTCTTGSFCSTCQQVAIAPLGHQFTEWKVIVQPSTDTKGLKVRYCLQCGEEQRVETAATGDITALEFESYDEVLAYLYDLVVSVNKASVEMDLVTRDYGTIHLVGKVDKSGYDTLALVTFTVDGEDAGMAYYKNGVVLAQYLEEYYNTTLDSAMYVSIDVAIAYMQAYYDLINPYVEEGIPAIRELITTYVDILGGEIDKILDEIKAPHKAEDMLDLLDSMETLYAYVSLRLGYTTAAEMSVEVPTKDDIINIITAFMESSTEGENTTYTFDFETWIGKANTLLDECNKLAAKTLETVIFEYLGEDIARLDPTVKDMDALAAYLKTKLPGTLKVSEALDVVESMMSEFGDMTLDDFYSLVNQTLSLAYGEEFDIEEMVAEYYSLTLNDFFSDMLYDDATAEEVYDEMAEELKYMTVGELYIDYYTIDEYLEMANEYAEGYSAEGYLSFTVDADGRFISLSIDGDAFEGIGSDNPDRIKIYSADVKIIRDENVKVEMPEKLAPIDTRVEGKIDENGNYVITGVPEDADLRFYLSGSCDMKIEDMLDKSSVTTNDIGLNVYATSKEFWTSYNYVADLLKIDGKYYTYSTEYILGDDLEFNKYICEMDLFEFLDNPAGIIPDENDIPVEYYNGQPIYASPIGYLMQADGDWWVYRIVLDYRDEYNDGKWNRVYYPAEVTQQFNFTEALASSIELTSINSDYYHGNFADVNISISLYMGASSYSFSGSHNDDNVKLICIPDRYYNVGGEYLYVIGNEVSLDQYDYDRINSYKNTRKIKMNGEIYKVEIEEVHLVKFYASYYIEMADGVYFPYGTGYNYGYVYTSPYFAELDTKQLSDGNTMYVLGTAPAYVCGYSDGEVTFGYVKISAESYIRAYCLEQQGYMVDVVYENCISTKHFYLSNLYDLNDYAVMENGVITIPAELVSKLLANCTEPGDYVGISLYATKSVGDEVYYIEFVDQLKHNVDDITISDSTGSYKENYFSQLFYNYGQDDKYEIKSHIDENGNLVLESAKILGLNLNGNSLPANPFLEYDAEKSQSTGLDIYSYEYTYEDYDYCGYIYQDGKYYSYNTYYEYEYDAEIRSLADCINEWKVTRMRDLGYKIYQGDDTPSEIHGKSVYKFTVTLLNDDRIYSENLDYYNDRYITVYGFFLDGKLQILTGAVATGESLVTFEGYKPFDEYMDSLTVSATDDGYYNSGYYRINGEEVYVEWYNIILAEPDYDVSYSIYFPAIGENQYVYSVKSYSYHYLTLGNEVTIPEGYTLSYEYTSTYSNGTYTKVKFVRHYTTTSKYYAVKLDGIFYSYDSYMDHLDWYGWSESGLIVNYETFRQQMYNTDRVYRVYDYRTGEYLYYNKFIPGAYFEGDELLEGFVLEGEICSTTTLGYTEEGYTLVEIIYYINGENSKVQQISLSDGKVMYHINGSGFVKFDDNMYVKAILSYDSEGRAYARYLFSRAYRSLNRSEIDAYFNRTGTSITITREMLENMSNMIGTLFYIVTPAGEVPFNYNTLEAYFNGEVS